MTYLNVRNYYDSLDTMTLVVGRMGSDFSVATYGTKHGRPGLDGWFAVFSIQQHPPHKAQLPKSAVMRPDPAFFRAPCFVQPCLLGITLVW